MISAYDDFDGYSCFANSNEYERNEKTMRLMSRYTIANENTLWFNLAKLNYSIRMNKHCTSQLMVVHVEPQYRTLIVSREILSVTSIKADAIEFCFAIHRYAEVWR